MALGKTNAGGGGGTGGTLVVTAPVGVTVTATNETLGKTYTRVANWEGKATFKGLASGAWAINMTDGSQTTNPVQVVVNSDYTIELSFFSATINVTYPAGSTCTATDGTTTLTAPDASGTWAITVPNAGTWTVTATDGDKSKNADVEITTEGQSVSVELNYELELLSPTSGLASGYSVSGLAIKPAIDVTSYTKMTLDAKITWRASSSITEYMGLSTSASSTTDFPAEVQINSTTQKTYALDISALNGDYFVRSYAELSYANNVIEISSNGCTVEVYSIKIS